MALGQPHNDTWTNCLFHVHVTLWGSQASGVLGLLWARGPTHMRHPVSPPAFVLMDGEEIFFHVNNSLCS